MTQTSIFDCLYPAYRISKPIRLIELFAGVGTQAMALRDIGANFEHHRVIEIDPFALKSYNAIHGTSFVPSDITQIHGDDLGIFEKRYEYIMTYSFPCQDLSKAGKQKGMAKDSGTRSGLLWEVERILKELNETDSLPQVLLMENVPDVIGEKNIQDFNQWYTFLESVEYQSYYKLLNAKNYGVPQSRNRCFMVSVLGNYSYTFPEPTPLEKKLRDVLESEVDVKYYINDEVAQKFANKGDISKTIRTSDRSSLDATEGLSPALCAMQGGNRQPFILQISRGYNKGGVKEICPTISTEAFKENNFVVEDMTVVSDAYNHCTKSTNVIGTLTANGNVGFTKTGTFLIHIKSGIRKLTPLECWRLMGFSDDDFYKAQTVNSNTQLYKQAGNGIVKQVLMAIFEEMIR